MKITISNPGLFYKKLATLFVTTVALIPLVQYKLYVPAALYIGALLLLHVFILYIYLTRVDWQQFAVDKKELFVRLSSVGFFIYLLTTLRFEGATTIILLNMAGAFVIHVVIMLFMTASLTTNDNKT